MKNRTSLLLAHYRIEMHGLLTLDATCQCVWRSALPSSLLILVWYGWCGMVGVVCRLDWWWLWKMEEWNVVRGGCDVLFRETHGR